ncbi:MAG TPA: hypothetical protein VEO00_01215, partial [Actinomycetota bacterium]|nr:hypothetical protein [Actinomycetota bacterium]
EAFARWADGLAATDPGEAAEAFRDAAGRFEEIGRPVERALILADPAAGEARAGRNGRAALEEARDILRRTGARLFLPDVEAALAAVTA